MAYKTKVTTTSTGKKIYYGGSLGEFDTDVEDIVIAPVPVESKGKKMLIWGAIIAAALYIFKK